MGGAGNSHVYQVSGNDIDRLTSRPDYSAQIASCCRDIAPTSTEGSHDIYHGDTRRLENILRGTVFRRHDWREAAQGSRRAGPSEDGFAMEDQIIVKRTAGLVELTGRSYYHETWKMKDGDGFLASFRPQRTSRKTSRGDIPAVPWSRGFLRQKCLI